MKYFLILSVCVLGAICQDIDDTFCNTDTIVSDDNLNYPIPVHAINQKYQALIEKNSDELREGVEIEEFYDGIDNVGISINTAAGEKIYTYSYYNTNELLLVKNDQCRVFMLNESFSFSPFYVLTNPDGSEHIVTELGLLINNPNRKLGYLGSKNRFVRGIPVREWQACYYSKQEGATVKATISYSNNDTWVAAVPLPGYESVPLQVKLEKKFKTGKVSVAFNIISQFRPGLLIKEEDFYTRSGVYCEGRLTKKPLPTIPNAFSFISQEAKFNDEYGYTGALTVARLDFDYEKKLFRYDYRQNGIRMTEIHDQNTNLKYRIDNFHDNCSISLLEKNSLESSSSEFFEFDQTPAFEYVGTRRVRGIDTNVWIAPRKMGNVETTWEWHFMTDSWVIQESNGVKTNEPVLLIINFKVIQGNKTVNSPAYFHVGNFDQTRINLFDFDISKCESIPNQHLRFSISSDKYELMKENLGSVKAGLIETISSFSKVNLIRVSRLETIFDNGTLYVLFTLLDRSLLGKADPVSLQDAIENLRFSISDSKFVFTFSDTRGEKFGIKADVDSLAKLDVRSGRYVFQYFPGSSKGYSTGSVIGFVIGFAILGLVIGLVAGVFLILRRSSIALPGPLSVFNPNFRSNAEA